MGGYALLRVFPILFKFGFGFCVVSLDFKFSWWVVYHSVVYAQTDLSHCVVNQ